MAKRKTEIMARWLFLLGLFGILVIWTFIQPFNFPPDESGRYAITEFIVNHGALPLGGEEEIMMEGWGFSYAFQPILPYIFSAFAVKFISLFSSSEFVYIITARLVNTFFGLVMAFIIWKLSQKLFKRKSAAWLFTCFVCLLPQGMFMHTYVNVDSLALMSSALIVYAWVVGLESDWNTKSCVLLGVGVGLCAMSYYNAYGFILCSIFIFLYSFISWDKENRRLHVRWKEFWKKALIAAGIAFLIAGWWFIRAGILYDGDFLGLRTRDAYAEMYATKHLKPSQAPTWRNEGFSIWEMFKESNYFALLTRSFVGMFEHMKVWLWEWMYWIYFAVFIAGIGAAVVFGRKKAVVELPFKSTCIFHFCMVLSIIIPNILCAWAAYAVDYQPQGRYILPMLVPFMYYVTLGLEMLAEKLFPEKRFGEKGGKLQNIALYAVCILLVLLMLYMFRNIIFAKYYNNFMINFKEKWGTFFVK